MTNAEKIKQKNREIWAARKARWDAWKKEQKEKGKKKS